MHIFSYYENPVWSSPVPTNCRNSPYRNAREHSENVFFFELPYLPVYGFYQKILQVKIVNKMVAQISCYYTKFVWSISFPSTCEKSPDLSKQVFR